MIDQARSLAETMHIEQVRKYTGEPYFNHCEAVAKMVMSKGGDAEQIAAAYLHDTIEDCGATFDGLKDVFGVGVATLVMELSDEYTHEKYPDLNRAARKKLEAERLGTISDRAKLIKWCDLADNTSSIVEHDPGFARIYLVEKARCLEAMGFTDRIWTEEDDRG